MTASAFEKNTWKLRLRQLLGDGVTSLKRSPLALANSRFGQRLTVILVPTFGNTSQPKASCEAPRLQFLNACPMDVQHHVQALLSDGVKRVKRDFGCKFWVTCVHVCQIPNCLPARMQWA
jgi:hypothetical protein